MIKTTYTMNLQYKNLDGYISNSIYWDGSDFKNNGNIWSCDSLKEAKLELKKAIATLKNDDYLNKWIIEVQENVDNYEFDEVYDDRLDFDYNIDQNIILSKKGKYY